MSTASDPAFLVLHALRLKGFADAGPIASLSGIDEPAVRQALEAAASDNLVMRRDGRVTGWSLTASGRQRHRELIAQQVTAEATRAAIESAYNRFKSVNGELLAVCTAWQVRNGVPNDHANAGYDADVVRRLGAVDDEIQPVCADLGAALDRFGGYGPRLRAARQRIEAGEGDWFTRPMIDSYHTVWFELHEDLLATLGIERSKEAPV